MKHDRRRRRGNRVVREVEADPPVTVDVGQLHDAECVAGVAGERLGEQEQAGEPLGPVADEPAAGQPAGGLGRIAVLQWPRLGAAGRQLGAVGDGERRQHAQRATERRLDPLPEHCGDVLVGRLRCRVRRWRRARRAEPAPRRAPSPARRRTTSSESPSPTRQSGTAKSASTSRAPASSFRSVAPSPSTAARQRQPPWPRPAGAATPCPARPSPARRLAGRGRRRSSGAPTPTTRPICSATRSNPSSPNSSPSPMPSGAARSRPSPRRLPVGSTRRGAAAAPSSSLASPCVPRPIPPTTSAAAMPTSATVKFQLTSLPAASLATASMRIRSGGPSSWPAHRSRAGSASARGRDAVASQPGAGPAAASRTTAMRWVSPMPAVVGARHVGLGRRRPLVDRRQRGGRAGGVAAHQLVHGLGEEHVGESVDGVGRIGDHRLDGGAVRVVAGERLAVGAEQPALGEQVDESFCRRRPIRRWRRCSRLMSRRHRPSAVRRRAVRGCTGRVVAREALARCGSRARRRAVRPGGRRR